MKKLLFILLATAFCACDTPHSLAWTYYYSAKDYLEKGDTAAALKYAELSANHASSIDSRKCDISTKVSELMNSIEAGKK